MWRFWFLCHLLHTWLQTVHAECHSLINPAESSHLHIAEMWFCDALTGHFPLPECALRLCPWKPQAQWWQGTTLVEPTRNIFQFQPRIQTQLSLWLYRGNIVHISGTGTLYRLLQVRKRMDHGPSNNPARVKSWSIVPLEPGRKLLWSSWTWGTNFPYLTTTFAFFSVSKF